MSKRKAEMRRIVRITNTFQLTVEAAGNIHLVPTFDLLAAQWAAAGDIVKSVTVTRRLPVEEASRAIAKRVGSGGAMIDWVAQEFLLAAELEVTLARPMELEPSTFIVLTHDRAIFAANLAQSPVLRTGRHEVLVVENAPSAALGIASALPRARHETVILIHHDAFLPASWETQCALSLQAVRVGDPQWGVLGVAGTRLEGLQQQRRGSLFDGVVRRRWGFPWELPCEVETLDEVIVIVRRDAGLVPDTSVPGFHGYGTQLSLAARAAGLHNYAILAECEHRSESSHWAPDRAYHEAHAQIAERWARAPYAAMYGVVPHVFPEDLRARVEAAWQTA